MWRSRSLRCIVRQLAVGTRGGSLSDGDSTVETGASALPASEAFAAGSHNQLSSVRVGESQWDRIPESVALCSWNGKDQSASSPHAGAGQELGRIDLPGD